MLRALLCFVWNGSAPSNLAMRRLAPDSLCLHYQAQQYLTLFGVARGSKDTLTIIICWQMEDVCLKFPLLLICLPTHPKDRVCTEILQLLPYNSFIERVQAMQHSIMVSIQRKAARTTEITLLSKRATAQHHGVRERRCCVHSFLRTSSLHARSLSKNGISICLAS